jgi:hypothetical protein
MGFEDGDLGGLQVADNVCLTLATAVGAGDKTWRAYLSVEEDPDNGGQPTHATDRIGAGPWANANEVVIATDVATLHALSGDADLFLDENGERVPGQWAGSPAPNEHDILTGSDANGMANGNDCSGWTSNTGDATVGHSDGLGPAANPNPPYDSWNSSHTSDCGNLPATGGAGRIYCFAID